MTAPCVARRAASSCSFVALPRKGRTATRSASALAETKVTRTKTANEKNRFMALCARRPLANDHVVARSGRLGLGLVFRLFVLFFFVFCGSLHRLLLGRRL